MSDTTNKRNMRAGLEFSAGRYGIEIEVAGNSVTARTESGQQYKTALVKRRNETPRGRLAVIARGLGLNLCD